MWAVTRSPFLWASSMIAPYRSGVSFLNLSSRSSTQILTMSTFLAASSCTAFRASASVRDPVRSLGAPLLRHRDPAPGGAKPRGTGDRLFTHLERHITRVLAHAHDRADSPVRFALQEVDEPVSHDGDMRVSVDNRRHDGLAGQVHASRARGNLHLTGSCRPGVKRPLSTMNAAFSMGALSSPTMSRAPSNTVTPVGAGACSGAGAEQAAPNNEPIDKRPATRATRHDSVFVRRIEPPAKCAASGSVRQVARR